MAIFVAMIPFLIVSIPLLAYLLKKYGQLFKIKIPFKKALLWSAILITSDILISIAMPNQALQIIVGILIIGVLAAIVFKYAFDLSWKSSLIITLLWFVTHQIILFIMSFFGTMIFTIIMSNTI